MGQDAGERRIPLVRNFQQFRRELAQQVLYRERAESDCNSSFGMAEIVESRRQIQIAYESTGAGPYEIARKTTKIPKMALFAVEIGPISGRSPDAYVGPLRQKNGAP